MKKLLFYIALTIVFITVVGYFGKDQFKTTPDIKTEGERKKEKEDSYVKFKNVKVSVEIADSDTEREKGLSGRERLGNGKGMLFVFEEKDKLRTFWMKDMKFVIDMIWINNSEIVKITKNIPPPPEEVSDANLARYSSGTSVDYILEVDGGFADKHNIEIGDSIEIFI